MFLIVAVIGGPSLYASAIALHSAIILPSWLMLSRRTHGGGGMYVVVEETFAGPGKKLGVRGGNDNMGLGGKLL